MYSLTWITVAVIAIFVICAWIVVIANSVQALVIPEITRHASLVFLPHGVKVLATCLFREKAIPGLVAGAFLSYYFLWGITDPVTALVFALASGTVAWLVLEGLLRLGINGYYLTLDSRPPPYRTFMLIGILTSVANGFLLTAIWEGSYSLSVATVTMAAIAVGDFVGLLVLVAVISFILPVVKATEH